MMNEIVINSESDVYELLEKLSDKSFDVTTLNNLNLDFNGWPILQVRMVGQQFNSSITAPIMKAFLELQTSLYRSFATVKYGIPNPAKLSKDEKQMLELIVKVEEGSSKYKIDLQQLFENTCKNLVDKMEPKHILIAVLSIAVLYFGDSAYKNYLDNRKEIRQLEIKDDEQKATLNHLKFVSQEETKRATIIAKLAVQNSHVQTIVALSEDAKAEFLKRGSTASVIEYQGIELTGDIAEELGKNARKPSIDIRLDGLYRVLNVDSSDPTEFKVKVRNVGNGEEFTAIVQDNTLERAHIQAIQNGEWERKLVNMTINAKQRTKDNTIYNAKVIFAELPADIEDVESN